jgi:hypothetical protein
MHSDEYYEEDDDDNSDYIFSPRIVTNGELDRYEEQMRNKMVLKTSKLASFLSSTVTSKTQGWGSFHKSPLPSELGLGSLFISPYGKKETPNSALSKYSQLLSDSSISTFSFPSLDESRLYKVA